MLFWCPVMLCCFGVQSCSFGHVMLFGYPVILCCFSVQSCSFGHVMLFWCPVILCCFGVQSCSFGHVMLFWCPVILCCFCPVVLVSSHVVLVMLCCFGVVMLCCFGPVVLVFSHVMLFWCLQWEKRNVCSTLVTHLCQWDSLQNLLVQFLILWQLQHMRQQLLQWYVPVQSTIVNTDRPCTKQLWPKDNNDDIHY